MEYKLSELQIFTHPKAEAMFQFPHVGFVEFEFPSVVRTLLFVHCGLVRGSLRGESDYQQAVARIYESDDPQGSDENHIGKLYIDMHGFPDNVRYETKVERLEWYQDGSFDLIQPNGERMRCKPSPN